MRKTNAMLTPLIPGSTTYRFELGDGGANLIDLGGTDTLAFGPGITVDDIRFAWEDNGDYLPNFKVYYGQNGDNVAIFKGETGTIERFSFADNKSYSFDEMIALKGFTAPNDPPAVGNVVVQSWNVGNPQLVIGTAATESIYAENDWAAEFIIVAGAGDDRIQINENDGTGIAHLLFNVGDGHDTINVVKNSAFNAQSLNTVLHFGASVSPESLTFTKTQRWVPEHQSGLAWVDAHWETDLTIGYGRYGDSIFAEQGRRRTCAANFKLGNAANDTKVRVAA